MRDLTKTELEWMAERSTAMHAELEATHDENARAAIRARHDAESAAEFSERFEPVTPSDISAYLYWAEPVRRDPGLVHRMLGGILGPEPKP